jgi:hypothetical protein
MAKNTPFKFTGEGLMPKPKSTAKPKLVPMPKPKPTSTRKFAVNKTWNMGNR